MRCARKWIGSGLVAFFAVACVRTEAGFFSKLNVFRNWSSKDRIETLIVTGNYGKSRLLAELAQHKGEHPIVLISPEGDGMDELFFLPKGPEAMAFESAKYVEFVDFLHPKRVVFLGDASYVPASYVDMVRDRYPTVVLNSEDWTRNAEALAVLIDYKKLPKQYSKYLITLEAASGGRPVPSGDTALPAGPEPVVPPMTVVPAE